MAEAFATRHHAAPGVAFTSAGTTTPGGWAVTPSTVTVMRAVGIDIAGHVSRPLSDVMARDPDIIYVMTGPQLDHVIGAYTDLSGRVEMLDPGGIDIADPYGHDLDAYVEACRAIEAAVAARATEWLG